MFETNTFLTYVVYTEIARKENNYEIPKRNLPDGNYTSQPRFKFLTHMLVLIDEKSHPQFISFLFIIVITEASVNGRIMIFCKYDHTKYNS